MILRFVVWLFSVAIMALGAGVACGQTYPNKPIRIVAGAPGGGTDFAARLIAQGLTASLGQQVIVDNRGGGLQGQVVSKAPPDGYTLLVDGSTFWTGPLFQDTPYDVERDFLPIALLAAAPQILVVHPSLPVKSVKELVTLAKARPGELNYAAGGTGSSPHLAAELFKAMAGVNIVRINYKGSGPALTALIGGEVQLMFATAGSMAPHVKLGRLKALAVTSERASALATELPTVAASGVPGYEAVTLTGIFAPAGTPATLINRLNQEIVRFLHMPEIKERLLSAGVESVGSSPEEFAARIKTEVVRWGKVIKDTGIRLK